MCGRLALCHQEGWFNWEGVVSAMLDVCLHPRWDGFIPVVFCSLPMGCAASPAANGSFPACCWDLGSRERCQGQRGGCLVWVRAPSAAWLLLSALAPAPAVGKGWGRLGFLPFTGSRAKLRAGFKGEAKGSPGEAAMRWEGVGLVQELHGAGMGRGMGAAWGRGCSMGQGLHGEGAPWVRVCMGQGAARGRGAPWDKGFSMGHSVCGSGVLAKTGGMQPHFPLWLMAQKEPWGWGVIVMFLLPPAPMGLPGKGMLSSTMG